MSHMNVCSVTTRQTSAPHLTLTNLYPGSDSGQGPRSQPVGQGRLSDTEDMAPNTSRTVCGHRGNNESNPSVTDTRSGRQSSGAFPGSEEEAVSHRGTQVSANRMNQQNLHDYKTSECSLTLTDFCRDTSVKSESIREGYTHREPTAPEDIFAARPSTSDDLSASHCPQRLPTPAYYGMYGYGHFQGPHDSISNPTDLGLHRDQGLMGHDNPEFLPHSEAYGYERSKSSSPSHEFSYHQVKSESVFDSGSCDDSYFSDRSSLGYPCQRRKRRGGRTMAAREVGVSDEDWERIRRRRERNKMAAQRCREKKRFAAHHLVQENQLLESSNTSLKYEIKKLQEYKSELEDALSNHTCKMAHVPAGAQRACTPQAQASAHVSETMSAQRACTPHAQAIAWPSDPVNRTGVHERAETVVNKSVGQQDSVATERGPLGVGGAFCTGYTRPCYSEANEGHIESDFRGQSMGTVGSFTSEFATHDNSRRHPGVFSAAHPYPCTVSRHTTNPVASQCSSQPHSCDDGNNYNAAIQSKVSLPFRVSDSELLPAPRTAGQESFTHPTPMNLSQPPRAQSQTGLHEDNRSILNQPNLDDIQSLLSTQTGRNQYSQ